mmetsp:Transcript_25829/g.54138  ORF Transcript_25829/g.54138 Transcript_25829/m.54138 type:complete len:375 (+) Transcript_25829:115-1239(+)
MKTNMSFFNRLISLVVVIQSSCSHAFLALPPPSLSTRPFSNNDANQSPTISSTRARTRARSSLRNDDLNSDKAYPSVGPAAVDMNAYNVPLSTSLSEWTALLSPSDSLQSRGIFLSARNRREHFVDTLRFAVKREGGLGLMLREIAGGREDGAGITVVEEVLPGGNAEGVGIAEGDSIVGATLALRQSSSSSSSAQSNETPPLQTVEERIDLATECLGYDATISALASLPPPSSPSEELLLTVKRIRRQPGVDVTLRYPPSSNEPDATLRLFAGENLRRAMLTRGIKLNDPLARRFDSGGRGDCGADGTCATCAVGIGRGEGSSSSSLLSPMKDTERQILKEKPGWRMACKVVVGYGMREGDLVVRVNPRQWGE